MTGFSVSFDPVRRVLITRVDPDFPDALFETYCTALRDGVAQARCFGPLLMLSDNRDNKVFGDARAKILWGIIQEHADPADRLALLLVNSVAKMSARDQARNRAQTFASENAAYLWLGAGGAIAA